MRTILQVVPALNSGGVERTTIEIAEALTRAGDVALAASAGGRLEPDLAAAGGELVRMALDSKNPLTIWANAGKIAALARARGVALIHARSRAPGWSAYWAAKRLKLPFVTTYHGIYNAKTPLKRWYNSVMAKGDIVIANSHYTRAHVMETYALAPERVVAIPRGVDLRIFDPDAVSGERVAALKAAWRIGEEIVLLLPARLTRWKGQALAIEAAARAFGERKFTLVLVGEGREDYRAELEALAQRLGVAANVRLPGHVVDMAAAYKLADIALTPSLEPEAFGRAAAEAQAMGVPVIAANHGGFTETIIHRETGLLAAAGDVEALKDAILTLEALGAEARAGMGNAAKARARELYSLSALQRETLRVYDRLLGAVTK
ncbi:MAG: glycosyltransferase family 4 protein [Hyphomonadaceae bacterium]|nr:glycosyltransferase family 4 protein [Hyphomonadaceae bacterium]